MRNAIPIIFVHKGDSFYLQYTFNQLKKSNPLSDIYLLGDEDNAKYSAIGIHHVNMRNYSKTADAFDNLYVHLSSNGGFVEKICFQRWMYIRDFVVTEDINAPFCCMDSDILVYENITDYYNRYCNGYDLTLHGPYGPGCNIFRNIQVLSGLIENTVRYYADPDLLQTLRNRYHNEKKNVTDMLMIDKYVREQHIKTYDLLQIVDNSTFDSHIAKPSDERFEMKGAYKKTKFENGHMYCFQRTDHQPVMMYMLHIQGFHKRIMYRYYHGDKDAVESKVMASIRFIYLIIKIKLARIKYQKRTG